MDDLWKTSELAIGFSNVYRSQLQKVLTAINDDQDVVFLSKMLSGQFGVHKLQGILKRRAFFRNHPEYDKKDKYGSSFKDFEKNHIATESSMYDFDPIRKIFTRREPKEDLSYMLRMLECAIGDRDAKELYDFVNMTCYEWYSQRCDQFVKSPENIARLFNGISYFGHAFDILGSGSLEAYFYCVPISWTTYRMISKKCQFQIGVKPKQLLLHDKDLIEFFQTENAGVRKQIDYVLKYREEFRCHPNYNVGDDIGFFYKRFETRESIAYKEYFSRIESPSVVLDFFNLETFVELRTCLQWYTQASDKFDGSLYNFNLLSQSICFFGHILDIIGCGGVQNYFSQIPVSFSRYKEITKLCKFYPNLKQIGDSTI